MSTICSKYGEQLSSTVCKLKTASAARILSLKQTGRPLPCLLILSFFYGWILVNVKHNYRTSSTFRISNVYLKNNWTACTVHNLKGILQIYLPAICGLAVLFYYFFNSTIWRILFFTFDPTPYSSGCFRVRLLLPIMVQIVFYNDLQNTHITFLQF